MYFKKLVSRYSQFGGFKLVWEYAKLGVLPTIVTSFFRCLVRRKSFKAIYPEVLRKIEPYLIERYSPIIQEFKSLRVINNNENLNEKANTDSTHQTDNSKSRIGEIEYKPIWFCWLQGINEAPVIVKACYNSLERHLVQGYEIKVIDSENWKEYVEMPEYIVSKWEKKRIPAALFSDLLRLELLIKYGGTWIDSTVLCTGFNETPNDNEKYLDADLFLFQYTKQGSIPVSISNWFITACTNNEVLMMLRDMLYAYWKDYDCTLDYYIFHLFFSMLSKEYAEEMLVMPYGRSQNSLNLLHHWSEKFDQEKWDKLTTKVNFHKLAFRISDRVKNNKDDYYNYILKEYGRI